MLTKNMRAVYKRLLVLSLLTAYLVVFVSSDEVERVYASACIQDCEAYEAMCYDNCASDCSGNGDAACSSCMSDCSAEFRSCAMHAEWCEGGGTSYSPNCQVGYADHCPVAPGYPNPNCDGGHSGYYLTCNTLGGGHCVACPDDNWRCVGDDGAGSCY
jgi:hypothetical protein